MPTERNTRSAAMAIRNRASPSVTPNLDLVSTPSASAPTALKPITSAAPSSTTALLRIRLNASPISPMSSVRIAAAIEEAASVAAARAGAAA